VSDYFIGLDLGQTADFSALIVDEVDEHCDRESGRYLRRHAIRHLKRWPLRTPYPVIVAEVTKMLGKPPLINARLVVDQTGVGAAVVDLFRTSGIEGLTPVLITAGNAVSRDDQGVYHVAKKELVSTLQVLLQDHRLQIAPALAHAETLEMELQNFRVKITAAANETFEAWRERDHDDLVLALALAVWHAERQPIGDQGMPMILGSKAW
jgi:hypothetical protein